MYIVFFLTQKLVPLVTTILANACDMPSQVAERGNAATGRWLVKAWHLLHAIKGGQAFIVIH